MRLAVANFLIAAAVCSSGQAAKVDRDLRDKVLHHARCATVYAAASRMNGVVDDPIVSFGDSSALLEFVQMNQDIDRAEEKERASLRNLAWVEQNSSIGAITRAIANSKDAEAVRVVFEKLFALCKTKPGGKVADDD